MAKNSGVEYFKRRDQPERKQRTGRGAKSAGDSEFVNRELTEAESPGLYAWREDTQNVFDRLEELLEEGYKVSLKYDDYSSSPCAFLFPPAGGENDGLILTGRGGDPYRALCECLYKHLELFQGVWVVPVGKGAQQRDSDW